MLILEGVMFLFTIVIEVIQVLLFHLIIDKVKNEGVSDSGTEYVMY